MKLIAENIKHFRKQHNLTQTDLAQKMGLSKAEIAALESEKMIPTIEHIYQLCQIFRCTPNDILIDENSELSKDVIAEGKYLDRYLNNIEKSLEDLKKQRDTFNEKGINPEKELEE